MNQKIAAAMSGGVDSSAAALLLRREGYDVVGVTLKLVDNTLAGLDGESACCSLDSVEDARAAARRLHIPHYVFNMTGCVREEVVEPVVQAYESGRPPPPGGDGMVCLPVSTAMGGGLWMGCASTRI